MHMQMEMECRCSAVTEKTCWGACCGIRMRLEILLSPAGSCKWMLINEA